MLKTTLLFLVLTAVGIYGAPTQKELDEWNWKIVGGGNAPAGGFPYQASLRTTTDDHFCGGSIITTRTILTAAHCLVGRTAAYTRVVVGTNTLNAGGAKYSVNSLRIHNNYVQSTRDNDIGLVIVSTDIVLGETVKTVYPGSQFVTSGVLATLTGWGSTSYPGSVPNNLQVINLPTISNPDCQSKFGPEYTIHSTQICTFSKIGEGACHGDSGGPLVSAGIVIGIVSWGTPCAVGNPDVFTRVSSHYTWISANKV